MPSAPVVIVSPMDEPNVLVQIFDPVEALKEEFNVTFKPSQKTTAPLAEIVGFVGTFGNNCSTTPVGESSEIQPTEFSKLTV